MATTDTLPPQLELERQLCLPLYAASRAVVRAYTPLLAPSGLTYPQYLSMLALWSADDGTLTVGELGTRLHLDSGTLTPLLKRLERAGLLERSRDAVDERRVLVSLTDAGRALRDEVASVPLELGARLGLDVDEAIQLHHTLWTLIHRLEGPAVR